MAGLSGADQLPVGAQQAPLPGGQRGADAVPLTAIDTDADPPARWPPGDGASERDPGDGHGIGRLTVTAATERAYQVPGATFIEREHPVPLDHEAPGGASITVFSREVVAPGSEDRPLLVFLQGGPGFEAARPTSPPSGWMKRALSDYRVLLLDQRGTGRSTPVGSVIPGDTSRAQAEYLTHFRADSIVRDAEMIRRDLGVDRWSLLGQSFGGFTTMTYLSFAPEGLREAFLTGGLSPIGRPVDDIYEATYRRLIEKNRRYFARYPDDHARVREILRRLDDEEVLLPSGDRLTARRFRQLGLWLGDSAGFELLHHVIELPFGSAAFLHDAQEGVRFSRNPIYATLHESSYADGVPTRWSAHRLLPDEVVAEAYFTAEHVFPWMWEDYGALRPQHGAAELLADHHWPALYDPDRLRRNEVPAAGTIYVNDLYVERSFAVETAATIRGFRTWETDELEHNGLRADGERVLGRLIDLVRGRA
jgi:pimeloyl-ACP methyl ester carboxylesterase